MHRPQHQRCPSVPAAAVVGAPGSTSLTMYALAAVAEATSVAFASSIADMQAIVASSPVGAGVAAALASRQGVATTQTTTPAVASAVASFGDSTVASVVPIAPEHGVESLAVGDSVAAFGYRSRVSYVGAHAADVSGSGGVTGEGVSPSTAPVTSATSTSALPPHLASAPANNVDTTATLDEVALPPDALVSEVRVKLLALRHRTQSAIDALDSNSAFGFAPSIVMADMSPGTASLSTVCAGCGAEVVRRFCSECGRPASLAARAMPASPGAFGATSSAVVGFAASASATAALVASDSPLTSGAAVAVQ